MPEKKPESRREAVEKAARIMLEILELSREWDFSITDALLRAKQIQALEIRKKVIAAALLTAMPPVGWD